MRIWFRKHCFVAALLWIATALAAIEGILVVHYLDSWLTLPLP
jgi:hypothetical protein